MITKIFGPPGCGKTTRLLKEMESALAGGILPSEIGFFSFTNQAANEAKTRAMEKFPQHGKAQFGYFRTLHSLAYMMIGGVKEHPCMTFNDWQLFAKVVGFPMTGNATKLWEETMTFDNKTKGDKIRSWCDLARLKGVTMREIWKTASFDNIKLEELNHFFTTLVAFKAENHVIDFCDMLVIAATLDAPKFKVLFIDEAQDLSSLQWKLVDRLVEQAGTTFIAGDDDQAIFTWAGADVKSFTGFRGEMEVLGQSYRLPKCVHRMAELLRKRITDSVPKIWASTVEDGAIKKYNEFNPGQLNLKEGQWMILVRNNYQLDAIAQQLKTEGYFFECKGGGIKKEVLQAIYTWERLRKDKLVAVTDAVNMYEFMRSGTSVNRGGKEGLKKAEGDVTLEILQAQYGLLRGKDDIWHTALDRLDGDDVKYVISCLKNGEKITKEPRIKLTTIHGAKGGEADNVFVFSDMSRRTKEAFHKFNNDEYRVWYVAITRTKKVLHLCHPKTSTYFEPLMAI